MIRKLAYAVTVALTVGGVVEIFYVSVLLIFALTSLALVGLVWVLSWATRSLLIFPPWSSAL